MKVVSRFFLILFFVGVQFDLIHAAMRYGPLVDSIKETFDLKHFKTKNADENRLIDAIIAGNAKEIEAIFNGDRSLVNRPLQGERREGENQELVTFNVSPLYVAVTANQLAAVKAIVGFGADLNYGYSEYKEREKQDFVGRKITITPLYQAADLNEYAIAKHLIDYHADVNKGYEATGTESIGYERYAKQQAIRTPLSIAEQKKNNAIAALLRSQGAKFIYEDKYLESWSVAQ